MRYFNRLTGIFSVSQKHLFYSVVRDSKSFGEKMCFCFFLITGDIYMR